MNPVSFQRPGGEVAVGLRDGFEDGLAEVAQGGSAAPV